MKKMLLVGILFLSGCCGVQYPQEMKFEVKKNVARMRAFNKMMEMKKLKIVQLEKMIKANLKAWESLEGIMK
jgi:hypothetical protein